MGKKERPTVYCRDCVIIAGCQKKGIQSDGAFIVGCEDGIKDPKLIPCCATCKFAEDVGDFANENCLKEYWGSDSGIRFDKMKCNEWEVR